MNSWIESISREISSTDDFTRKGPKVDIKAFDEVVVVVVVLVVIVITLYFVPVI